MNHWTLVCSWTLACDAKKSHACDWSGKSGGVNAWAPLIRPGHIPGASIYALYYLLYDRNIFNLTPQLRLNPNWSSLNSLVKVRPRWIREAFQNLLQILLSSLSGSCFSINLIFPDVKPGVGTGTGFFIPDFPRIFSISNKSGMAGIPEFKGASWSHPGFPKLIPVPSRIPEITENSSRFHPIPLPIPAWNSSLLARIFLILSRPFSLEFFPQ